MALNPASPLLRATTSFLVCLVTKLPPKNVENSTVDLLSSGEPSQFAYE